MFVFCFVQNFSSKNNYKINMLKLFPNECERVKNDSDLSKCGFIFFLAFIDEQVL